MSCSRRDHSVCQASANSIMKTFGRRLCSLSTAKGWWECTARAKSDTYDCRVAVWTSKVKVTPWFKYEVSKVSTSTLGHHSPCCSWNKLLLVLLFCADETAKPTAIVDAVAQLCENRDSFTQQLTAILQVDDADRYFNNDDNDFNKMSPWRDVTLLARRVLPPGELRCAVECYRRRQTYGEQNKWHLNCSGFFAGLMNVTNRPAQTDRQTDRPCCSVCSNSLGRYR